MDDALRVAESAKTLGLVEKGTNGRLALHLCSEEELAQFAHANKYDYDAAFQRCKVSGIPLQGLQGENSAIFSNTWDSQEGFSASAKKEALCELK